MSKIFQIIDNSVRITDSITNSIELSLPKKTVWYKNDILDLGYIELYDISDSNKTVLIPRVSLIDAVDENSVAFTKASFIDFAIKGFNTPGATGVTEEALNEILTTHIVNLDTKIGDIATALDILNGQIV